MINRYIPYEYAVKAFNGIINKCQTVQEANALFKAKEAVTAQVCNLIDLQPVKHGKWLNEYLDENGIWRADCSNCKGECAAYFGRISITHKYCEYCGARMDGESE